MGNQIEDNYNDLMDEINNHREHRIIASISNDSNRGSSLSNFGIDIDNPEENERYILQNQAAHAVIQGIGVEDRILVKRSESGLASSISKTRDSEFSPIIIEYPREISLNTQSLLNEKSEGEPDTEAVNDELNNKETDEELQNIAENLQEIELSTFDLAIEKGYHEQAKIYYDDVIAKGLKLKTKFLKSKQEILEDNNDVFKGRVTERDVSELGDGYFSKEFVYQQIFMLQKDFKEYLENIKKNEHKKILKKLKHKENRLNKTEQQIEKNINTKDKRNNLELKGETIKIIQEFIERLDSFEIEFKDFLKRLKSVNDNEIPGGDDLQEIENKNDDSNKEDAVGYSQPSCSKQNIL